MMETGELARSKYAVVATWSNRVQSGAMCIRLEFKAVLEADESAATKKDVHAALAQLKKLQDAQDAKDKGRLVATLCNTLRHDVATPCNTLRHDATQQHAPKQRDSLQSSCRGPRIRAGRAKAICALRQIWVGTN